MSTATGRLRHIEELTPVLSEPFVEMLGEGKRLKEQIKAGKFDEREADILLLRDRAAKLVNRLNVVRADGDLKALISDDNRAERHVYLWTLSWTADALEYLGDSATNLVFLKEEGANLSVWMRETESVRPQELRLARQKVWVILHYAYACLYRKYEYSEALDVLETCEKFVRGRLANHVDFPCFYTWARIAAYRAAILRQLGDLKKSQASYEESLDFIYRRLTRECENPDSDAERIAQEETRARYEAAKTLSLGVGFCQFMQGRLQEARVNVLTAIIMLAPIHDVLRRAYAQLLLGSIKRAEAGFRVKELTDAIEILEKPHLDFIRFQHPRYTSRAEFELALAHLYRAMARQGPASSTLKAADDYQQANTYINRVLEFSRSVPDWRWESAALIVMSRIARSRAALVSPQESAMCILSAQQRAQEALALANKLDQDIGLRVDAEIACGEALMAARPCATGDIAQATEHFQNALNLGRKNPKLEGISHLHLAEANLANNNIRKGLEHWDHWEHVSDHIQHGILHDIAKRVQGLIKETKQAWYVAPVHESLNYEGHARSLRTFLLNQAEARHDTVDAISASLGIKRATYYNWVNERDESEPSRSTQDPSSRGS